MITLSVGFVPALLPLLITHHIDSLTARSIKPRTVKAMLIGFLGAVAANYCSSPCFSPSSTSGAMVGAVWFASGRAARRRKSLLLRRYSAVVRLACTPLRSVGLGQG